MIASALLAAMALLVKEVPLQGCAGKVAFAAATPRGIVVTTYDPIQVSNAAERKLLWYGEDGQLLGERALSTLRMERPTNPVWTGRRLLLADMGKGTLLALDANLEKSEEFILKGSHPYPYYPRYIAFSSAEDTLFVTGC